MLKFFCFFWGGGEDSVLYGKLRYNVTTVRLPQRYCIHYDITLLMTLFDALSIAVGAWNFHKIYSRLD